MFNSIKSTSLASRPWSVCTPREHPQVLTLWAPNLSEFHPTNYKQPHGYWGYGWALSRPSGWLGFWQYWSPAASRLIPLKSSLSGSGTQSGIICTCTWALAHGWARTQGARNHFAGKLTWYPHSHNVLRPGFTPLSGAPLRIGWLPRR